MADKKAQSKPKRSTLQRLQDELAAAQAKAASKVQAKYDAAVAKLNAAEARYEKAQDAIDAASAELDAVHAEATELGVTLNIAAAAVGESSSE